MNLLRVCNAAAVGGRCMPGKHSSSSHWTPVVMWCRPSVMHAAQELERSYVKFSWVSGEMVVATEVRSAVGRAVCEPKSPPYLPGNQQDALRTFGCIKQDLFSATPKIATRHAQVMQFSKTKFGVMAWKAVLRLLQQKTVHTKRCIPGEHVSMSIHKETHRY